MDVLPIAPTVSSCGEFSEFSIETHSPMHKRKNSPWAFDVLSKRLEKIGNSKNFKIEKELLSNLSRHQKLKSHVWKIWEINEN